MRKTRFTEQQIIGILKVFPLAQVHLVSWKDRRAVAAALKEIQRAPHAEAGRAALEDFAEGSWDRKYSAIAVSWRRHWADDRPPSGGPLRMLVQRRPGRHDLRGWRRRPARRRGPDGEGGQHHLRRGRPEAEGGVRAYGVVQLDA
jgi:putative transposase